MSITPMSPPAGPTDDTFPVWTNLVDNWRAEDAHWIRNRVNLLFTNVTERTTDMAGSSVPGMLSTLQTVPTGHPGGPDFYNGSAWESIRYPNLLVSSDSSQITLRRSGAGSGISLATDGSVSMAKANIGTGGVGSTLDSTGIYVKVGVRTVKLASDATALTVDSPVKVTGNIDSTGTVTAGVLTAPTVNSSTIINANAVTAAGAIASNTTVQAGTDAVMITESSMARFRHKTAAAWTGITAAGAVEVRAAAGAAVALFGPAGISAENNMVMKGTTSFQGQPTLDFGGGTGGAVKVAGILIGAGVGPGSTPAPDGTLWVQV